MLEVGKLVDGKYKILSEVGQGGMSVVYLAVNEKANKQWAVKEVRKDGIKDFEIVKQGLIAETDILKKLNHPNLPSIVDVIDEDDSFIIIMDYIQGNSLNKVIDEYGAQPQDHVISWAKQLCDVLGYLHTRNPAIIYRDMKPANIMLKPDGNITLIDFGTAREFKEKNLADTTCLGTVGYAAPEQFGGMGQTDARTDIYCLGATLYHLLTGMNPCEPPYQIKPIRDINPALSGGLERIILKCTQRDPNDRYQSADELMYALEHYEEIDDQYRKKQKKKLLKFVSCMAMTAVMAATSAWGFFAAKTEKINSYDRGLVHASAVEDYYDTIVINPERVEAYLGNRNEMGLIEFLISDGELSGSDDSAIDRLRRGLDKTDMWGNTTTVDVLAELKENNPTGYQEVCYQIGEAYLFYYKSGEAKDKYINAAMWFQHSIDQHPISELYCDIAECMQKISKFSSADQSANFYKEYKILWEQVRMLKIDAENYDDDLKLRVWSEVVDIIINNTSEICEAVSNSDVTLLLNEIKTGSLKITNSFLQENISILVKKVESAKELVRALRADSPQN